jgi:hypothetical protein
MRKLSEVDPFAADVFSWPLWRLASAAPLTLAEVHALMLNLPIGIRLQLIGSWPGNRFLRWPSPRAAEVLAIDRENNIGGFMALLALMREAELEQDPNTFFDASIAMQSKLNVVRDTLGDTELADELCEVLICRFTSMRYVFRGAYEQHPLESLGKPLVQTLLPSEGFEHARQQFEEAWKTGGSTAFAVPLKNM